VEIGFVRVLRAKKQAAPALADAARIKTYWLDELAREVGA